MNAALLPIERLKAHRVAEPHEQVYKLPTERPLLDRLARPLSDLRLSVTDRCNFRCSYCMPRTKIGPVVFPSHSKNLLSFEELERIAATFVDLGVSKLRITGGEPLVRRDLATLVKRLARLSIRDLCLTTNGSLLGAQAQVLADAGLGRVTVSLDALDEPTFRRMTDGSTPLSKVLAGIDMARRVGLGPLKINMVVQRGVNEHAVLPMADWARRERLELRYIEYMDVGSSNGWQPSDVLTARVLRERIHQTWPIEPVQSGDSSETAQRFRYCDGGGHLGIVAAISRPFCGGCTRARVSSQGELYSCLFAPVGIDLAKPLRNGKDLRPIIAELWQQRTDRYSEMRAEMPIHLPRPEMSAIGG